MADREYPIPNYELRDVPAQEKESMVSDDQLDWSRNVANLGKVWPLTQGENIKVAILDSGIMEGWNDHPDFKDAIVSWKNFTSDDENDIVDLNNHGTLIASIIGARKSGDGVVGVAPKCELVIGKVAEKSGYNTKFILKGLQWLLGVDVDIISLSLSDWCKNNTMYGLIRELTNQGKIVICSAGNDRFPPSGLDCDRGSSRTLPFPAWYPETIAVGSINRQLRSHSGANGDEIDFVAPGKGMMGINRKGRLHEITGGTSFAAPFVAGIAALVMSYQRSNKNFITHPIRNVDQLRLYLKKMSIDLGYPGMESIYGMGLPVDWNILSEKHFINHLEHEDLTTSGFKKLIQFLSDKL